MKMIIPGKRQSDAIAPRKVVLIWWAVIISTVLSSSALAAEHSEASLRAGAAMSNITPPLGEPIVGGWKPTPATHIHDELYARCLVLEEGDSQVAIVLCDNVGIPREVFDAARRIIDEKTTILPEDVLIASTHTHSATTARSSNKLVASDEFSEYQQFVVQRIADGVRRAINHLEAARIAWGTAELRSQVFNRRWHMEPEAKEELRNPFGGVDQVRMNPPRGHPSLVEPAGPIDPEIAWVSVQSSDGRPIALLANYSLHYVGGVPRGHVSADYFGVFAERIAELLDAEKLDPPFVGILSNGTSADINNINFRKRNPRMDPYEKMRQVGRQVAERVYDAHQDAEFRDSAELDVAFKELKLKVRKPTEEQLDYIREIRRKPGDAEQWHRREDIYADRVMRQLEAAEHISIPLQALRIGEVGIAAIPFEVFAEIGLKLKNESPFPQTFTIELANGSYGYLPTPLQHELGGYETWLGTSTVEKRASEKIEQTILEMLDRLAQ